MYKRSNLNQTGRLTLTGSSSAFAEQICQAPKGHPELPLFVSIAGQNRLKKNPKQIGWWNVLPYFSDGRGFTGLMRSLICNWYCETLDGLSTQASTNMVADCRHYTAPRTCEETALWFEASKADRAGTSDDNKLLLLLQQAVSLRPLCLFACCLKFNGWISLCRMMLGLRVTLLSVSYVLSAQCKTANNSGSNRQRLRWVLITKRLTRCFRLLEGISALTSSGRRKHTHRRHTLVSARRSKSRDSCCSQILVLIKTLQHQIAELCAVCFYTSEEDF